jgi:hypothetical protein
MCISVFTYSPSTLACEVKVYVAAGRRVCHGLVRKDDGRGNGPQQGKRWRNVNCDAAHVSMSGGSFGRGDVCQDVHM